MPCTATAAARQASPLALQSGARRPSWRYCGGKRAHLLALTKPPPWCYCRGKRLDGLALALTKPPPRCAADLAGATAPTCLALTSPPTWLVLLRRRVSSLPCTQEPADLPGATAAAGTPAAIEPTCLHSRSRLRGATAVACASMASHSQSQRHGATAAASAPTCLLSQAASVVLLQQQAP